MSFLLDTDTCSAHFRRPGGLAHRFFQHSGSLFVSAVNLAELYTGAYHVANPQPLLDKVAELLRDVTVLPFDANCAHSFGQVRGGLLQRGIAVPTADLMIGATALTHNLTLVTHNTKDYQHIPGLRLEDWLTP
ncbi:MAG TPA: type II toxin-antitoxin system VapC family toxin [Pirellulaceae bacterium]|nr:type II toxin-antitoxin system VapC family toxin [Pirellulaceae bacterium]